jgi:hypothetical protein
LEAGARQGGFGVIGCLCQNRKPRLLESISREDALVEELSPLVKGNGNEKARVRLISR